MAQGRSAWMTAAAGGPTTPTGSARGVDGVYHRRMRLAGLLIDLDGTLYVGGEPVAGAREAVASLKDSGLAIRYVTNTTREPRRLVCERLLSLGFEVEEREIFTPARAAAGKIGPRSCFALVDESLLEDLEGVNLTDGRPDYVLVGDLGEGFTYERLNLAFRHLMEGADLMALQKNKLLADRRRNVSGCGAFRRGPGVR